MRKDDPRGKFAVVTGASGGIGLCFCRELASRGCSLLMISNMREELELAAGEIAYRYGVEAYTLCLDLTEVDAAGAVVSRLGSLGKEADYLINNAGIFSFLPVAETDPRKIECFIRLHVDAVTSLSREFAIRFMERGRGRILNMSSMSCWMPMPGIAMYSATKAYIRVFSRALHYEVRDLGVTVTVACPGGIATDLFGLGENLKKFAVAIGVLDTPARFARKAVDRMLRGRRQYINGLLNRFSIVFVSLTPTWVRMLVKRKMLDKNVTRP